MKTLRLSIFSNYGTVPLQIALDQGFYESAGLNVHIEPTTSSIQQMTGLIDGRYDIAATAIDNVIAYNCGQGAAPTSTKPDLKVFLGSASYRLPFVVAPNIKSFDDLSGSTIAVDALSTGFAFLLREMLELNGLNKESYTFKSFGAPKERWQAIQSGEAVGALLNEHFEAIAHKENCKTLISSPDPWDNYEGNTFCASTEFLKNDAVALFITATLQAVVFTKTPDNIDAVVAALINHVGKLTDSKAHEIALSLQGKDSIILDNLPVSLSGINEVLRLREKYTDTNLRITAQDLCDSRVELEP